MTQFYKGQKVFDPRYEGEGEVLDTNWDPTYPLYVKYKDGITEVYLSDGRDNEGDKYPILSTQEYHRPEPQWTPQKGELVWVRKGKFDNWEARYFFQMRGDRYECYLDQIQEGGTTPIWQECHPFEPRPF